MLISLKEINPNVKCYIEAAKNGHGTVVEEMLSNGMLVDKSAEHGYTALMLAAYTDKKEVISLWIKWGADVDKKIILPQQRFIGPHTETYLMPFKR